MGSELGGGQGARKPHRRVRRGLPCWALRPWPGAETCAGLPWCHPGSPGDRSLAPTGPVLTLSAHGAWARASAPVSAQLGPQEALSRRYTDPGCSANTSSATPPCTRPVPQPARQLGWGAAAPGSQRGARGRGPSWALSLTRMPFPGFTPSGALKPGRRGDSASPGATPEAPGPSLHPTRPRRPDSLTWAPQCTLPSPRNTPASPDPAPLPSRSRLESASAATCVSSAP